MTKWFTTFAFVVFTIGFIGCTDATAGDGVADPCKHVKYDGKEMEPYADDAHKFALCIPKNLKRQEPGEPSDGRVVFSGFAVPAGTNLESKTFVIVVGAYPNVPDPAPFGQFTAGGVTFQRTKAYEGHAGHMDFHLVYSGTVGGKTLHFDFIHFAVSPYPFDPGSRPAVYDEAAQIKLTEVIMETFRQLP